MRKSHRNQLEVVEGDTCLMNHFFEQPSNEFVFDNHQ
jgi:hypothetical protein